MILYLVTLFIFVVTESTINIETSPDEEFKGEQPYDILRDIDEGNAIPAVLNLLRSQRTYHNEIKRLYDVMLRKNEKHEEYSELQNSIDSIIEFVGKLITNTSNTINAFLKNGSASDDFKREPLNYKTCRELNDAWKFIDEFLDNYIKLYDFDVDEEVEAAHKPIFNAIEEIEAYTLYLDRVYNKTENYRDEEINFVYSKYGRDRDSIEPQPPYNASTLIR